MTLAELKLPTPKATLIGSSIVVVCAWLFLDFAVTDPSTILFAFIALGSDILVRNLTSGFFTDRYWPVVVAVQTFFCLLLYILPAFGFRRLGGRWFSTNGASLMVLGWFAFYLAALAFLFDIRLLLRLLSTS